MRDTVKADVTQEDSPDALEAQSQPAVSLVQFNRAERANQPQEETTIEDEVIPNIEEEEDLSNIEVLDLTNMEEEDELEDVSRENLKELLDQYVEPYRIMIQQIQENSVGIDTSQDNETPRIVELGPENSNSTQVDLYQMVSWSRLQPTPSEDIITQPEEETTQNETANVEATQKEQSVPQEPATCNQRECQKRRQANTKWYRRAQL
ncbi:hypothetical protein WMY93_010210 [Mugilogobius chulae]|uniref:Uncharacterized protein n=1 Tax=Mugilogobius chulae TaxID=88201 RepID=A0AAW0PI72_9GOBI